MENATSSTIEMVQNLVNQMVMSLCASLVPMI